MAECHQCQKELQGNWRFVPTRINISLGIRNGWFLSRSPGIAWAYCDECFSRLLHNQGSQFVYRLMVKNTELDNNCQRLLQENNTFRKQIADFKQREQIFKERNSQYQNQLKKMRAKFDDADIKERKSDDVDIKVRAITTFLNKRNNLLSACHQFQQLQKLITKLPASTKDNLKHIGSSLDQTQSKVASAINDITTKHILEYKQSITKSLKYLKTAKERELSQLQHSLQTIHNNMIQTNVFSSAEIKSMLQTHYSKIEVKRAQLEQLTLYIKLISNPHSK